LARDHREFPALFLDDGDVLFNRTNSAELVGKAAVFRNELEPCSFASYLIRVSLNPGYMPEFLVYFLLSPLGRSWVQSVISQQVGQANVNGTKLRQLTVPVPPLKQQKRICSIVNDQLNLMDEMRNKIVGMRVREEHLRLSLLRRAFTGKPLRQSTNYEQRPPSHSSQWMAMS
jgi:type I restriction enzyme S subunit